MLTCTITQCDRPNGNVAGASTRIALLNNESREEIETVVRKTEKIETAVETKFQEYFVNAMAIPHKTDSFPNLQKAVMLPAGKTSKPNQAKVKREAAEEEEPILVMLAMTLPFTVGIGRYSIR